MLLLFIYSPINWGFQTVGATIGRPAFCNAKCGAVGTIMFFPYGKTEKCSIFRRTSNARPYNTNAAIN